MRFALILLLAASAMGQSALPETGLDPSLLALAQIRYRMAQSLQAVRNYTCAETVRRTQLSAKTLQRMERRGEAEPDFADTVRLEVAVVDGKEMYSWPGDAFRPVPLSDIVGFGLTATGAFSSFARSLFVTSQGRIRFAGEENAGGRRVLRYDYAVPLFRSGYVVTTAYGSAAVAYEGSFRADAETYELLSLTARGVELPPELRLREVNAEIRYHQAEIGDETLTLAKASVFEMRELGGPYSRNETVFEDCREFGATSELSFDVGAEASAQAEPETAAEPFKAPAGALVHLAMETPIGSEESRVGDAVEARLQRRIVLSGRTLAEKGTTVRGRLRRVHRVGSKDEPFYAVSLEFGEIQTAAGWAAVSLELVRLQQDGNISRSMKATPSTRVSRRGSAYGVEASVRGVKEAVLIEEEGDRGMADAESFYVRGTRFLIEKGFQMTWRVAE